MCFSCIATRRSCDIHIHLPQVRVGGASARVPVGLSGRPSGPQRCRALRGPAAGGAVLAAARARHDGHLPAHAGQHERRHRAHAVRQLGRAARLPEAADERVKGQAGRLQGGGGVEERRGVRPTVPQRHAPDAHPTADDAAGHDRRGPPLQVHGPQRVRQGRDDGEYAAI